MKRKFADFTEQERKENLEKARKARKGKGKPRFTRAKAIRYKCLDCCCGSSSEVAKCNIRECSLWEFRFGKNPTKEMVAEVANIKVHGRDKELYIPRPKLIKI